MTASAAHGDRPALRSHLTVALPTAALSTLVVCCSVAAAPHSVRGPLGWGAGAAAVLLCAAVTVAAHGLRSARAARTALRAANDEAQRALHEGARAAEQWRRENQRLGDAAGHERARLLEDFAHERVRLAQAGEAERHRLAAELATVSTRLERAVGERAAAISATANAAARMQALATGTLADLRAMEDRHSDEDVLADLLHLDHRTAQAGRLADSIAVLTGARSGRRWARPIAMESILRGAMGRISGYQRIRLHSVSDSAVAGFAAEGVMHALAELLDNAANFSPPNAEVHVYVEEVPAGVIVSVEDSGLVMGDVQLRRAEQAVAGDVAELGGLTGTRLGLAVVGRLARKHGLKISFRPSARGGTGVLMLIPQDILTAAPAEPRATAPGPSEPTSAPAPRRSPAASTPVALDPAASAAAPADTLGAPLGDVVPEEDRDGADDEAGQGPSGLPKRRRGRTLAAAERSRSTTSDPARRTESAADIRSKAARFGSFREAVRAGTEDATGRHPLPPDPDEPRAAEPAPPETAFDTPSHSHAYPEGDTTS
ncbi:sensor histidine kinase [Streptomyces adustus]|uniref:sensor histidine kinase n=1 Tax=Streptomyces adustus TaxID=1609272 RepID=UPI00371E592C